MIQARHKEMESNMLGPYDQDRMVYDRKQHNQFLQWEYPDHDRPSLPASLGTERQAQLIKEADIERRVRDLPRRPSWTARFTLKAGAWLVKAGCRLERLGFGRFGAQSTNSTLAVDCGCS
jgi:hypothetical protein